MTTETKNKAGNVLDLVKQLENTRNGKTLGMIASRYRVSYRTAKRYIQAIKEAGHDLQSEEHGLTRKNVYWIES